MRFQAVWEYEIAGRRRSAESVVYGRDNRAAVRKVGEAVREVVAAGYRLVRVKLLRDGQEVAQVLRHSPACVGLIGSGWLESEAWQ